MNWETIYEKNKNRKTQEIQEITSDFSLKTNIKYLPNNYKKALIISFILSCILIIITLSSIKAIISALLLLITLLSFSLFFHSYSISGKNSKIVIKTGGQEIEIAYSNLKNIYLEEQTERIFFKKRKSYFIVILYETPNRNIYDISLPSKLLSPKKMQNWFDIIKVKPAKINYQEKCLKYKRKRFWKKAIFYSIFLLLSLAFILFFY